MLEIRNYKNELHTIITKKFNGTITEKELDEFVKYWRTSGNICIDMTNGTYRDFNSFIYICKVSDEYMNALKAMMNKRI